MAHGWLKMGRTIYVDSHCKLSVVKLVDFIEYIDSGVITIPDFQRDPDRDKIEDIVNTYKNKKLKGRNWFIEQGQISLCGVPTDGDKKLYVVDGQHRITAMQKLREEDVLDGEMLINITKCDSLAEMKDFYAKLNINTVLPINYNVIEDIFFTNELLKVKNKLKQSYKTMFGKTRGNNSNVVFYHIDDFINKFSVESLKKHWEISDITCEKIWRKLMEINDAASSEINKIRQKEKIGRFANAKPMEKMNAHRFYLSFKSGVQWDMFAENYNIRVIVKKNKCDIPSKIRSKVWRKQFPDSLTGTCYCCGEEISNDNYECGHKISEYNGGNVEVSNLEPVCGGCNKSMGIMHMDVFKAMFN